MRLTEFHKLITDEFGDTRGAWIVHSHMIVALGGTAEELMDTARKRVFSALKKCEDEHVTEWASIKATIRDVLSRFIFDATRRRPMILPIIMEA